MALKFIHRPGHREKPYISLGIFCNTFVTIEKPLPGFHDGIEMADQSNIASSNVQLRKFASGRSTSSAERLTRFLRIERWGWALSVRRLFPQFSAREGTRTPKDFSTRS